MKKVYFKDNKFFIFKDGKAYQISSKGIVAKHPYGSDIREGAKLVEGFKYYEVVEVPKYFKNQLAFEDFKEELKLNLKKPKDKLHVISSIVYAITSLKRREGDYYTIKDVFTDLKLNDKKVIVKSLVESLKAEYDHFIANFKVIPDETLLRIRRINEERIYRYMKVNNTLDKRLVKFQGLLNAEAKKRGLLTGK